MHIDADQFGRLASWIRSEVDFPGTISEGARGRKAAQVQEWLNLHGVGLSVDADYGPITARSVARFQDQAGLEMSGEVDAGTFAALTAPMRRVLRPVASTEGRFGDLVHAFAEIHLAEHPREVGGQNCGPWVRMYMKGHQGNDWPWCAGFVSFLMEQAAEARGESLPMPVSFSCDSLALMARERGLLKPGGSGAESRLRRGALFLVRRTSTDWTHTGLVSDFDGASFETIEGNTNDEGSREGYEVCARMRGYSSKDFIVFP